jgi:hypothetical protein
MTSNRRDWLLFTGWLLTGACYLLVLLTALSIGIFILPLPVAGTLLLATRRGTDRGLPGLVSSASLPMFLLAYLNRHGPGTYCEHSAGGESCTDGLLSPWLLLLGGLLVLAAGVALFLKVHRRPVPNSPARGPW